MTLQKRSAAIKTLIDESMRHRKGRDCGRPDRVLEAVSLAILDGNPDAEIVDYAVHSLLLEVDHGGYLQKQEVLGYALRVALWGASDQAIDELMAKCIELGFGHLAAETAKLKRRFLSAEEIDALMDVYIADGNDWQDAVSLTEMPNISVKTIQKLITALNKEHEKYPNLVGYPRYIEQLEAILGKPYSLEEWKNTNWTVAIRIARLQGQFFSLDSIQEIIAHEKEMCN